MHVTVLNNRANYIEIISLGPCLKNNETNIDIPSLWNLKMHDPNLYFPSGQVDPLDKS